MPPELDEANIDVGDSEENATEINLSPESEPVSEPEPEIKVSASTDELEEYSSNVKGRINDLTKRFREEERQKQTAIEFAESVRKENENLKTRLDNLDKGYIEQFEGRVDSQLESAKKALKEAHEVGDVDKIVDAQEALSQLSLERSRVNVAKAPQPEPTQAPVAPATPQPQQPTTRTAQPIMQQGPMTPMQETKAVMQMPLDLNKIRGFSNYVRGLKNPTPQNPPGS